MIRKALPLLLLGLCACGNQGEAPVPDLASQAPEAGAPAGAPAEPAPVGPISSRGETVASAPAAGGGIDYDLPQGWQNQPPSSSMRMAEASIPGPGGPGSLAVFFFGPGGGGGVEANLQRWHGQMETSDPLTPETFEANGYKVTWMDIGGTLLPSGMGMGPTEPQPNSRLFGAVVEGPGGPWFFKVTGPEATLAPQREAFIAMLKSVRPQA